MYQFSLIPQTAVFHFIDAFLGAFGFCVGVILACPFVILACPESFLVFQKDCRQAAITGKMGDSFQCHIRRVPTGNPVEPFTLH
jgi:hypothetical protein